MKKMILVAAGVCVTMFGGAGRVVAQDAPMAQSATPPGTDKTAPSYDMKAQAIYDLQDLQKKFVGLAEAIPAEKYSWRPAEGVRSFSELFLHIAAANYNIPTMMGAAHNSS